jgi:glycosyltransferase involved in cell wall biosynthesis
MSRDAHISAITYYNPDLYPPIVNGARLLARHGFELDLYCRDNGEEWSVSYPPQVQVVRVRPHLRGSWLEYIFFVASVLREARGASRLVVGHDAYGLLPAWLLAKREGCPLVYHCHDFVDRKRSLHFAGRMLRAFERRFARTADLVIVPDKERGELVARELQLTQPPLIVANAPLKHSVSSRGALKKALRQQDLAFERIVFRQGRVGEGHAIEVTLRSMKYWSNQTWGFVVMGLGREDYRRKLIALSERLGVDDRFVILPPVAYDEVMSFTSDADVGHALYEPITINHSTPTTSSNKAMEYLSAGLPLLASDSPSMRGLVKQYGCGVVADESNPQSVATAVNEILNHPRQAGAMGIAGRKAFEEVFCYEQQFAPAIDAFQKLIYGHIALNL